MHVQCPAYPGEELAGEWLEEVSLVSSALSG